MCASSSSAGPTTLDTGVRSGAFQTIDGSGLYDTGLMPGQFDTGVKSGHYDITIKSSPYQTGVKSSQYSSSIVSGQFDTGLKSGQYDSVKSGQYGSVKSGQYDVSLKSGQYDTGVRSGQYDLTMKSGHYDGSVRSGQYDTLDAVLPTFSWSTSTLPSASTTVVAGTTSSYTYQSGTNNMPGGSSPVGLTSPSSLSGEAAKLLSKEKIWPFVCSLASFLATFCCCSITSIYFIN